MIRYGLYIVLLGFLLLAKAEPQKLNFIFNYEVNFLHFIDHLSQWSSYTGDVKRNFYDKYFEQIDLDKKFLTIYAEERTKLGWEGEALLFAWARKNYSLDYLSLYYQEDAELEEKLLLFSKLKGVIDYFKQRTSAKHALSKIMEGRFSKLKTHEKDFARFSERLSIMLRENEKQIMEWSIQRGFDYQKYPLYVLFNYKKDNLRGSANGPHVYAEFEIETDNQLERRIKSTSGILIHEFIHHYVDMPEVAEQTIQMAAKEHPVFQDFLLKNKLTADSLLNCFASVDPAGKGNEEMQILEECLVSYLANIRLGGMDDERIKRTIKHYDKQNEPENARQWYGAWQLKKIFEKADLDGEDLRVAVITTFYNKIYFKNYSLNLE